jgi:pimeloyl-ACP methyl ester carboxylesterase
VHVPPGEPAVPKAEPACFGPRRYAIDDWADQTIAFLEEVVLADAPSDRDNRNSGGGSGGGGGGGGGGGVRLVGNSLGGLLAALLAARRPDLVKGIVLLNATPIWGSDLPGWDARLPAPPVP